MKNNNKINVLVQLHKDGELTGGFRDEWNNEVLSIFLLNLEGDISISRIDDNSLKIIMSEENFYKTYANLE